MSDEKAPTPTCPSCGKESRGNFCHHCGASLGGRFCNQCGNELAPGAKFCNQCGAPVGKVGGAAVAAAAGSSGSKGKRKAGPKAPSAGGKGGKAAPAQASRREAAAETFGGSNLPWWIAGTALFGLILVVGWSMVRPAGPAQPTGGVPAAGAAADPNQQGMTDISQMTPREAADRLFNRVMTDISQGDTAAAMGFQPMAVQAYERAEPLDMDGVYHQALLELLADPAAALESAQRILDEEPGHILALGVAARASLSLGDVEQAEAFYQRLLDGYEEESARALPEYTGHANLLTDYRTEAQDFLSGG